MVSDQPLSMAEVAIALHEAFQSFTKAGFTEQQALYLVGQILMKDTGKEGKAP